MTIVNQDHTEMYTCEHTAHIFTNQKDFTLRIVTGDTRAGKIGEYSCDAQVRVAFDMLAERIQTGKQVVYVPTEDEVKTRINAMGEKYHHKTGKKTKGHGGS